MKLGIFLQHYFPYGGLQRDAVRLARASENSTLVVSTNESFPEGVKLRPLHSGGYSNHRKLALFASDCQPLTEFDRTIAFSRVPGCDFHFCGDTCFKERFQQRKPALASFLPRYRFLLETERRIFGPDSKTHIFFLAESEIPPFEKHYGIKSSRYTVLPPWLDPPEPLDEGKSSLREELSLSSEVPLLLFVASNYHLKGLDRALKALADLSREQSACHLIVCGKDELPPFQKLAEELKISDRVHFLGPRDDIPAIMSACDLLVHPARQEAAGMVLTESLVQRLPVLCTSVCGYSKHTREAGCPIIPADPSPETIALEIKGTLARRSEIVSTIEEWCRQPGRFETARIMLDRIARGC